MQKRAVSTSTMRQLLHTGIEYVLIFSICGVRHSSVMGNHMFLGNPFHIRIREIRKL